MFMTSKARAAYKLLRKKAGLRYVMDVIPLDATLIKGSHGRLEKNTAFHPVLITDKFYKDSIRGTEVYDIIWEQLTT
jgi:hypothetical protein